MEVRKETNQLTVDYKCPNCEEGYMRPNGHPMSVIPLKFPHKCTHCDYIKVLDKRYPYTETRNNENTTSNKTLLLG